jgi:hypothetical protein
MLNVKSRGWVQCLSSLLLAAVGSGGWSFSSCHFREVGNIQAVHVGELQDRGSQSWFCTDCTAFSHSLAFFVQKGTSILNCNPRLLKWALRNFAIKYFWLSFSLPLAVLKENHMTIFHEDEGSQTFRRQLRLPHRKISYEIKFLGNVTQSYAWMLQVSRPWPHRLRDKVLYTRLGWRSWFYHFLPSIFSYILFDFLQLMNILLMLS